MLPASLGSAQDSVSKRLLHSNLAIQTDMYSTPSSASRDPAKSVRVSQSRPSSHPSAQSQPDSSFLDRRLRRLFSKRSNLDAISDSPGPLGLSLLFQPADTFVDFVFVHGLCGDSRKTWSATHSLAHFWPKEWLPADPDFKNVRIHSFGYQSDPREGRDKSFNVHDFGKALVEELKSCPTITRDCDTPIILIGHSMGGLVIKKACIISRENPVYDDIGKRIHSMYFLATPHRGADLAQLLNNILRITLHGSRSYVTNLERGSEACQTINDQFPLYYKNIVLHSFVESISMNWGLGASLVVPRESATLGMDVRTSLHSTCINLIKATPKNVCRS